MNIQTFALRVLVPPALALVAAFTWVGMSAPQVMHHQYVDGAPVVYVHQERIGP